MSDDGGSRPHNYSPVPTEPGSDDVPVTVPEDAPPPAPAARAPAAPARDWSEVIYLGLSTIRWVVVLTVIFVAVLPQQEIITEAYTVGGNALCGMSSNT